MIKYVVLSKIKKNIFQVVHFPCIFHILHDAESQQKANKLLIFLAFFNGLVKSGIPFPTKTLIFCCFCKSQNEAYKEVFNVCVRHRFLYALGKVDSFVRRAQTFHICGGRAFKTTEIVLAQLHQIVQT